MFFLLSFCVAIAAVGEQADLRPALLDYLFLAAACCGTCETGQPRSSAGQLRHGYHRTRRVRREGMRSSPPVSTRGSRYATSKKPRHMLTREPRCGMTGLAAAWTGTPPTSPPRISRAPPGSPHRVGSSAWQRSSPGGAGVHSESDSRSRQLRGGHPPLPGGERELPLCAGSSFRCRLASPCTDRGLWWRALLGGAVARWCARWPGRDLTVGRRCCRCRGRAGGARPGGPGPGPRGHRAGRSWRRRPG